MTSASGKGVTTNTTVCRWFSEFRRDRVKLSDDDREGQPKSAVTRKNVNAVRDLINKDRLVTYREIQLCVGIGMR